jgi:hypothetical protein
VKGVLRLFVIVTASGALGEPSPWLPNASGDGVAVNGCTPVPVRLTVSGTVIGPPVTFNTADCGPRPAGFAGGVGLGLNTTLKVQVPPAAVRTVLQVDGSVWKLMEPEPVILKLKLEPERGVL